LEAGAEPPPERVLWGLGLEADSEVDVLLELLLGLELPVLLPALCDPVLAEPVLVVDVDAVPVLGVSDGMQGAGVARVPGLAGALEAGLAGPLALVLALAVDVLLVLTSPAAGSEQAAELGAELEPVWSPVAPWGVPPDLVREDWIRLPAPVTGAWTGPPPSGSKSRALTARLAAAPAVAASLGAVDTVASTAPAMA